MSSQNRSYTSEGASSRTSQDISHTLDHPLLLQAADTISPEELTDEDLNKPVQLELVETPVMWLLDIPGTPWRYSQMLPLTGIHRHVGSL